MKKFMLIPLFLGGFLFAQKQDDAATFKNIADEMLTNGTAYSNLYDLTKNIGNRLSGTESYEKSVQWAAQKLREAGADKVWLQDVTIPVWVRGKESLHVKIGNGTWQPIKMLSMGNSEGTGGKDLTGELICVRDKAEFDKLPDEAVRGKIVLFNYPFDQTLIRTGKAYGEAGIYRRSAASWVGTRGGRAAIIRSLTSGFDDVPHTGTMRYDKDDKVKIPGLSIGAKSADMLQEAARKGKIFVKLNSNATMKEDKKSHSVIGEITGREDQSVIAVGGHLDSWDVGEGASDDGTGIVQAIEIIRTFKKLGIKPRHTIRAVCFANEENGVRGGNAYAEAAKKNNEKHLLAIESDGGGFTPRGIALDMDDAKRRQIQSWAPLFLPYGVYDFEDRFSGTDVEPLHELGVPTAELVPDSQRYFEIHHTAEDTFEKVNRRELLLGAAAMAQLIYIIDQNW